MKKILLATNVITAMALIATLTMGCPSKTKPLTISNTCTPCQLDSSEVYKPLKGAYIMDLISNYRDNQWNWISSNPSFRTSPGNTRDSRSVWFSLDKLKDFIATIESAVESDTTEGCGGRHCERNLGIRIYFGTYGLTHQLPNAYYNGKHTLVMIPTYQNKSQLNTPNENVDFDPRYMNACGMPVGTVDTVQITALVPTLDIDGMNHGTIIPPPDKACTGAKFMHWADNYHSSGSATGVIPYAIGCQF